MKIKFISLVASFLLLLCCVAAPAMAQEPSCTLQGGSAFAVPGSTVEINVDISNNPGIIEADLTVSWDEGLTLVDASVQDAFAVIKPNHDGGYENGCVFSWKETQNNNTSGIMMTLTFKVSENAVRGQHYCVYVEMNGAETIPGNVYVVKYVPGDVTGEGTLNMKDIVTFSRYASDDYMTNPNSYNVSLQEIAADVNNDGKINMKDLVTLKRFASDDYTYNPDSYMVELVPSAKACKHPTLTHVPAAEASATAAGNVEYWHCDMCGKCFSDANGANQIAYGSTILPKADAHVHDMVHTLAEESTCLKKGNIEYWTCQSCGNFYADEAGNTQITLKETELPLASHKTTVHYVANDPTCTEPGNIEHWECEVCHDLFEDAAGTTKVTDVAIDATGHDLVHTEPKEATCTEQGNREFWTCETCDKHFADVDATEPLEEADVAPYYAPHQLTHHGESGATCTEPGVNEHWTCDACGGYFRDAEGAEPIDTIDTVAPATGHVNLTYHAEQPATCTEPGNIEYWSCSDCGKLFRDELAGMELAAEETVIPARHSLVQIDAKPATCTEQGNIEYWYCSGCGKYFVDGTLESEELQEEDIFYYENHSLSVVWKSATCTEDGIETHWKCNHCGKCFDAEEGGTEIDPETLVIKAHHSLEHILATDSTCTVAGTVEHYHCEACSKNFKDEDGTVELTSIEAPLAAHVLKATAAKEATCTEDGNIAYWTCNNCHKHYSDENGETEVILEDTKLTAPGHSTTVITATAKTCTTDGNHEYWQCESCGLFFKDQAATIPTTKEANAIPAGHEMEFVEADAPTCTENGHVEHWYCAGCDHCYADKTGDQPLQSIVDLAPGHSLTAFEAKNPTCTEEGNTAYWYCSTCETYFADEACLTVTTLDQTVLSATGHQVLTPTAKVEAQCTVPGMEAYWTCTCGAHFSDDKAQNPVADLSTLVIPATGHSMKITEAKAPTCATPGNDEYWTCQTCGHYYLDEQGDVETQLQAVALEAIAHRNKETTKAVLPTCTEPGNIEYWYCPDCDTHYKDETCTEAITEDEIALEAKGHQFVDGVCECGRMNSTEGLVFTLNEDGKSYTLTGVAEGFDKTSIVVDLYNNLPVTAISGGAATTIEILDGTKSGVIGASVTEITLGKDVASVDPKAFVACDNLAAIHVLEGNATYTVVGNSLMNGSTLVLGTVNSEINATTIATDAFAGRSGMGVLAIPASVTEIQEGAFYGCSNLFMIIVEEENTVYKSAENCLIEIATNTVILGCAGSGHDDGGVHYIVPNGVEAIGPYAFAYTSITSFITPPSVTNIGEGVAQGCELLETVDIQGALEDVGETVLAGASRDYGVFYACMYTDSPNQGNAKTKIGNGAFKGCKNLKKVNVGNGVSDVGSSTFEGCEGLNDVTIGSGVSEIDSSVFNGCGKIDNMQIDADGYGHNEHGLFHEREEDGKHHKKLVTGHKGTKLTKEDGVTEIGEGAFSGVSDLTEFEIPETVETIGKGAFKGTGLTEVEIPDSVTTIGEDAFADCENLTTITIGAGVREIAEGAFSMVYDGEYLHTVSLIHVTKGNPWFKVEGGCLIHIKSQTVIFGTKDCVIPTDGSVTRIGAYAFAFSSIENIVIPETVTEIGTGAFLFCQNLNSLDVPASVATIGDYAFYGCSGFETITVAANNAGGFYAQDNCLIKDGTVLLGGKYATIPTDPAVTAIGYGAFAFSQVERVEIPNNITTIAESAFDYCSQLTAVILPTSVTSLHADAFAECPALSDIYYLGTAEQLEPIKSDLPKGVRIHYMEEIAEKAPTCDQVGYHSAWTCSACGTYYTDHTGSVPMDASDVVIPATGHSLTAHGMVEATCTSDGVKAYWSCSVCNRNYGDAEGKFTIQDADLRIPAKDHTMTEIPAVAPGCTTEGNIAYWTCSDCHKNYLDANGKAEAGIVVLSARGHLLTAYAAKAATCTEAGNIEYWHCTECDSYYGDAQANSVITLETAVLPATGHTLTHYEAKEATCTEAGNMEYWTCVCGKHFSDADSQTEITLAETVIPMTGHDLTAIPAKGATCTEEGNIAYWTCSDCTHHFRDAEGLLKVDASLLIIAPKGHTLTAHDAKEATCTEAGNIAYWTCVCGQHFADADAEVEIQLSATVVAAKGHSLTSHGANAATCDKEGNIAYWTCECGKVFRDEKAQNEIQLSATVIVAKGHTLIPVAEKAATCTEVGNHAYWACSCGKYFADAAGKSEIELSATVIGAKGHVALTGTDAKEATCTEAGNIAYWTCECGKHFEDKDAKIEIKLSATILAPKGHSLTAHDAKNATCTEAGNIAYWTCECGKHFADANAKTEIQPSATVIAAKGHVLINVPAKNPTCTEAGRMEYWTCATCKVNYRDAEGMEVIADLSEIAIEAEGHMLTHTDAKAATCTEAGNTEYWSCTTCGKHFSDEDATTEIKLSATVIAPKGHSLTKTNAVKPTCTEAGNTAYWTCSECNKLYSDMYGRNETTLADTVVAAKGHTLTATEAKAETCTEAGNHAYWTCSDCGKIFLDETCKTETILEATVIAPKGHNYVNYVCQNCGHQIAPETYTVTFVDHDGTVLKTQTKIPSGGKATAPSVSGRDGYVFIGWDKEYNEVTSNLTVTAQYKSVTAPTVAVNHAYATVGDETVDVVISLLNNPGIASLKFRVTYGDELILATVEFSEAYGAYVTAPEPYDSPLPITFISPLESVDASGTFVTLTFHISDSIKTETEIDITVSVDADNTYDEDLNPVNIESMDGKVIIQSID
ncbi:MAG: leucine-rich repeat protein [Clostridia bacterium]|nr:leucine-rich repeat protein [Clostridia bacterium]